MPVHKRLYRRAKEASLSGVATLLFVFSLTAITARAADRGEDAYRSHGWTGWSIACVMVVLMSWVFYRFVAPRGWREWSRAGLVQAFVISLYAEMFGFPLTLYALTTFAGIKVRSFGIPGHVWSPLLGAGLWGGFVEETLAVTFDFLGLVLLVEGWRQVYRATREGRFAATGLYALVRHPQYVGIFLVLFGELIHSPTLITLPLFPILIWAYVRLARKEELRQEAAFGDDFRRYRRQVPMFFPTWQKWPRLIRIFRAAYSEGSQAD